MTQAPPPYQPPGPPPLQPQMPPSQPAQRKPNLFTSRWAFGAYGFIIGAVLASMALAGGTATTAQPAPSTTVTVTAPPPDVTEGADEPSDEPTTQAPASYTPKKADWKVGVKVTKKECFGEAGCLVTVAVKPQFVGSTPPPDTGTVEVTYELTGTKDPLVDSFTVEGGQIAYTKSQDVQTKSSRSKIGSKITDVTYDE